MNLPSCTVYVFYFAEDNNYPLLCILLTEVLEPLQSCEHCSIGYPDCRNITAGVCTFSVGADNTALTSYQFTEVGDHLPREL